MYETINKVAECSCHCTEQFDPTKSATDMFLVLGLLGGLICMTVLIIISIIQWVRWKIS